MPNSGVGAIWRGTVRLDGKTAWDAFVKYGSVGLAGRHLINPATDRPYASRTIQVRAYEYAMYHQDEVRSDWEAEARRAGVVPDEAAWKRRLASMAHVVYYYTPGKYDKFIAENGLQEYTR